MKYAQLYTFPSPGLCTELSFLLLLFPWKLFFSSNKILEEKKKSLCLKILFRLQGPAPTQEAFLQSLGSVLCTLTTLYPSLVTQHSDLLIIYAFFPSSFIRSLKAGTTSFVQWPVKRIRWGKGRRREEEERKEKKREDGRSTWWGGKFSFKVFLVIQELLAEARSFDYTIFFPGQFWETE